MTHFSVPRGRPLSEGKLVRKGIHLKSQDKDSRKKEPAGWMRNGGGGGTSRKPALTYNPRHQRSDELSDSTSADAAARPPPRGGRGGGNRRYSSSDQEKRNRRFPSSERSFPLQVSIKSATFPGLIHLDQSQQICLCPSEQRWRGECDQQALPHSRPQPEVESRATAAGPPQGQSGFHHHRQLHTGAYWIIICMK